MTTTFSRHLDHATFKTNYANVAPTVSGGLATLPNPFDSAYESSRIDWNNGGNRVNRNNFDQFNAFTDVLSIGKARGFDTDIIADGDPHAWNNDDFSIEITSGPALYALAFEIINNKKLCRHYIF